MALIVEDGSGVENANSYGSIADARAYAADRGITLGSDPTVSAQLVNGTDYLESFEFIGIAVDPTQSLSWPRSGLFYPNGDPFPSNLLPPKLISALFQLVIEQFNGIELSPSSNPSVSGGFITEEKVDVLMTKFSEKIATTTQPLLPKVDDLLFGLIVPVGMLRTVRI